MISFRIEIKGVEAIIAKLNKFPSGLIVFLTVVAQTLLPGLREYAAWKKVTRKQAYGVSFFSVKQQRAFFAKLNSGEISVPYRRTGEQGKAWQLESVQGNRAVIGNRNKSVVYTRGQTALHKIMGWATALAQANKDLPKAIAAGWKAWKAYVGF